MSFHCFENLTVLHVIPSISSLHSLDVFGQISCFIFFQGKGKGKGKGKATRDVEETSQDDKPAQDKKETKKLRTLDVFAGCGGSALNWNIYMEKSSTRSCHIVLYTTKYFESVSNWIEQGFVANIV